MLGYLPPQHLASLRSWAYCSTSQLLHRRGGGMWRARARGGRHPSQGAPVLTGSSEQALPCMTLILGLGRARQFRASLA